MFEIVAAQTKRALVIGISEYQQDIENAWDNIHGANDAELISSILVKQGFKTTKICNKSATASRIRKEIKTMIASCKNGDIIYLHFSCHGQPFEDLNGDEDDGWDESLIPYDAPKTYQKGLYEGANHILDDELHEYFNQIRTKIGSNGFLCVVIDACHAGGSARGDEFEEDEEQYCRGTKDAFSPSEKIYRPRINASGHFVIERNRSQGNILILEACRSYQFNYEIKQDGKYYGPLSYYVSKVLKIQTLTNSTSWVLEVKRMMDGDQRLVRQNMVYETSLK